jgi:hypothetical protein
MMTGQPLKWEVVSGAQARKEGHPTADLDTEWLKVHLARPVPKGGEGRVLIDKTYKDAKSYYRDGDTIVFDRSLGIRRNAVVLPLGYRLISCNVPSQVMATPDGRVMITFLNTSASAAPLVIRAKPGLAPFTPRIPATTGAPSTVTLASQASRLSDRAHRDREIVSYFPNDPSTHSFKPLSRPHRVASRHRALLQRRARRQQRVESLGGPARHRRGVESQETISGAELKKRGLDAGEAVTDTTQIVVISFPAVKQGQSARLRITSVLDANRYVLDGDELVLGSRIRTAPQLRSAAGGLDGRRQLDTGSDFAGCGRPAHVCISRTTGTMRSRH